MFKKTILILIIMSIVYHQQSNAKIVNQLTLATFGALMIYYVLAKNKPEALNDLKNANKAVIEQLSSSFQTLIKSLSGISNSIDFSKNILPSISISDIGNHLDKHKIFYSSMVGLGIWNSLIFKNLKNKKENEINFADIGVPIMTFIIAGTYFCVINDIQF